MEDPETNKSLTLRNLVSGDIRCRKQQIETIYTVNKEGMGMLSAINTVDGRPAVSPESTAK